MGFLQKLYLSLCYECNKTALGQQDLTQIDGRIAEIARENMLSTEEVKALLDKGRVIHSKALIGEFHRKVYQLRSTDNG